MSKLPPDITDWEFGFVLPNLVLQHGQDDRRVGNWPEGISFGSDLMAVVGFDDPRVLHLRSNDSAVEQILRSFVDMHGKPYKPAVLLLRPVISLRRRT